MFGKPSASPPYVLQVLTTDYLIQGTVDGNTELFFSDSEPLIQLNAVQIQATGLVDMPTQTYPQFTISPGSAVVALIPHKEISLMRKYQVWKIYTKPLQGIFYVGPYVMQGRMMMQFDNRLSGEMPLMEAHIASQSPETHWGTLQVPFALINPRWVHGFAPQ